MDNNTLIAIIVVVVAVVAVVLILQKRLTKVKMRAKKGDAEANIGFYASKPLPQQSTPSNPNSNLKTTKEIFGNWQWLSRIRVIPGTNVRRNTQFLSSIEVLPQEPVKKPNEKDNE